MFKSFIKGNHWKPAVVLKRCHEPRSSINKTEDDHIYKRNRKHTRQTKIAPKTPDESIKVSDEDNNKLLDEGLSQDKTSKMKELVELPEESESEQDQNK